MVRMRHLRTEGQFISNALVVKILIAFFLLILIYALILNPKVTFELDEKKKMVKFEFKNNFQIKNYKFPFSSIKKITIHRSYNRGVSSLYYVNIVISNGKRFSIGESFYQYDDAVKKAEELHEIIGSHAFLDKNLTAFIFNWF
jgi:hypothetical protein